MQGVVHNISHGHMPSEESATFRFVCFFRLLQPAAGLVEEVLIIQIMLAIQCFFVQ